jgi:hypothetical protein
MEVLAKTLKLALAFLIWVALVNAKFCENTPTSRQCWGEYSAATDYSTVTPDTGVTREASHSAGRIG